MPRYKNLHELLLASAAVWSNDIAFRHISGGRVREYKYGQIARLSYEYAQALYARGIRSGNRIIIWADDSPEWAIACLAAWRLGATIIPIDPASQMQELEPVLDKLAADLIIVDNRQDVKIAGKQSKVVPLDEIANTGSLQTPPQLPSPSSEHPAIIALTSGVTGPISTVQLSHGQIVSHLRAIRPLLEATSGDRFLCLLPKANLSGLTLGLVAPLWNGSTVIIAPQRDARQLLELMSIEKVKFLLGSPAQLERLLDVMEERVDRLPRAQRVALAIARKVVRVQPSLAPSLLAPFYEALGPRPEIWISGLAPVTAVLIEKVRSLGMTLVDTCAAAESSPALAELVAPPSAPLDLQEVQLCLNESPWIKESCVFNALDAESTGMYAAIVPSEALGPRLDKDEKVRQAVIEQMSTLSEEKRLSGYQIWDEELPRTIAGEIRRSQVAALYEARRKQKSKKSASKPDPVYSAVCEAVAEVMDPEVLRGICPSGSRTFAPDASLIANLSLDDFARMELIRILSESLGVQPAQEAVERAETIEDLVVVFKRPTILHGEPAANRTSAQVARWPRSAEPEHNWPYRDDPWVVAGRMLVGIGLRTAARIYNDFQTVGADRLVIDPPYIIAANHGSNLDTLALLASFPPNLLRHVHPVTDIEPFFSCSTTSALSSYLLNAVPFDSLTNLQKNLEICGVLLRHNKILVMFPEEGVSTGGMSRLKPGLAYLSIAHGCPIVPAYISGAAAVSPPGTMLPKAEPIKISFGLPIYPSPGNADIQSCRELTNKVRQALEALGAEAAPITQPAGS